MATKSVSEELTQYRSLLTESWGTEMHTAKKDKGMFKGKGKGEIGSALSKNKKTAANDRAKGKAEPASLKKKIKQEEFALRAKNKFGKVSESISLNEGAGMSFEHLLKTHHADVDAFIEDGELTTPLFDALYEYYFDEMPYGVAKGRTGDPYEWIMYHFQNHLEQEGLMSDNTENLVSQAENIGEGKSHEQKDCKLCGGKLSAKACAAKLDKKKEVKESKFVPGPFSKLGQKLKEDNVVGAFTNGLKGKSSIGFTYNPGSIPNNDTRDPDIEHTDVYHNEDGEQISKDQFDKNTIMRQNYSSELTKAGLKNRPSSPVQNR